MALSLDRLKGLSLDKLIDVAIDVQRETDEAKWALAAVCYIAVEYMGAKVGTFAESLRCTDVAVRNYVKTFRAFPVEEMRIADLGFSLHTLAAQTDDPERWINEAADNEYSYRQLQQAIKGKPVEKDELSEAVSLWERVIKAIEKQGPGAEYLERHIEAYPAKPK